MKTTQQDIIQVVRSSRMPLPSAGVLALTGEIRARHGDSVLAVLFYGACLRNGKDEGQIADLYVLVDNYRQAGTGRVQALLHHALPPAVYYLEAQAGTRTARAKYALLSLVDFERGTSRRWFHSYLWGRFAQPTEVLYARDESVRDRVYAALADAATTLARRSLPCLAASFDAHELWESALKLSYSAELRTESPERVRVLIASAPAYYERLAEAVIPALPFSISALKNSRFQAAIPRLTRRRAHLGWLLRQVQGKPLSLLRLIKALATFDGGVDYIAWKIERHSGIVIEVTPALRRHPLLKGWGVLWRLYRQRGIR
jgi:hypothetical protein